MIIKDIVDQDGIKRRVKLPDEFYANVEEGIPVSVPVDNLYLHMPVEFRRDLVNRLWDVGLIEPKDFAGLEAMGKIRSALLFAAKRDTLDIVQFVSEFSCK